MKQKKIRLWYDAPAENWNEALPLGNGRLGGMLFGHPDQERITLNEDGVWYGCSRDRNNPHALSRLEEVRGLLREGKLRESQELAVMTLSGVPESQRHYMPLGDLWLSFPRGAEYADYSRALDLDEAVATVEYTTDETRFTREAFASYPDGIMAVRLVSDKSGAISFSARLGRGHNRYLDKLTPLNQRSVLMSGECRG